MVLSPTMLEQLRISTAHTYEDRRRASESCVARWEWATGPLHTLIPLDSECNGWPRGHRCTSAPENPVGYHEFGFDDQGELCVIRNHTEYGPYETFVESGSTFAYYYHYRDHDRPRRIIQRVLDETGRLVAVAGKSAHGHTIYRYEWDGSRLVRLDTTLRTGDIQKYAISYRAGQLHEVALILSDGTTYVVFSSNPPNLAKSLETMVSRLPGWIYDVVSQAAVDEPVFCLILAYSFSSREETSCPKLVLGLESERANWRTTGQDAAVLFNPTGLTTFDREDLELLQPELERLALDIALALPHQSGEEGYEAVRSAYITVAKALAERDWSRVLQSTEDFIVLPIDFGTADFEHNARAVLGADATKLL